MSKPLAHNIIETPIAINTDVIKPAKGAMINRADNLFFIKSRTVILKVKIAEGILMLLLGIGIQFTGGFFKFSAISIILFSMMLIGLYRIILGVFKPKKNMQISLDRIGGVISFPAKFFKKPIVGSFKEIKAYLLNPFLTSRYGNSEKLRFHDMCSKTPGNLMTVCNDDSRQEWSFYVWYMDKNRPLPPGSAFDDYRQQDFERRKAAGFPPPLYKSLVPTPEATPAQQAEREKIGRW